MTVRHLTPAGIKLDVPTSRAEDLSSLLTQPPQLTGVDGDPPQILVLKVGTSTLMDGRKNCFSLSNLGKFVDAVCDLNDRGFYVVMISSGAVGSGCVHMHMPTRPTSMVEKQAISAIGQCRIVRLWEDIFAIREKKVAQMLLTRHDLIDRPRFVNFRNTLLQLLKMGVIPIINENDALATEGLKFGDNDTLGAYVSVSIGATWFFMLTDVDCLFTANPRLHTDSRPIAYVARIESIYTLLDDSENAGTEWGSGGMRTKINAAKVCCATGIHTGLCNGSYPERIVDIINFADAQNRSLRPHNNSEQYPVRPMSTTLVRELSKAANLNGASHTTSASDETLASPVAASPRLDGSESPDDGEHGCHSLPSKKISFITFGDIGKMPYIGTIFAGTPCTQSLRDQRRWILSLPVRGKITCDDNCVRAVIEKRKSLFAAGILSVENEFFPGEAVAMYGLSPDKRLNEDNEIARFITNFSSHELERIRGKRTCEFQTILGYYCAHEVAHRSNIIFVNPGPVYEKYAVTITADMVGNSSGDEEDDEGELEVPKYLPVVVPDFGESQTHV